jgi:hypothetical protein
MELMDNPTIGMARAGAHDQLCMVDSAEPDNQI